MNSFDIINGLFGFLGAPFILLSVIKLYKQKQVKGVSWVHAGFFTVWGWWNLLYYPSLDQWVSFWGGIAIVIVNSIWLAQMIYYSVMAKRPEARFQMLQTRHRQLIAEAQKRREKNYESIFSELQMANQQAMAEKLKAEDEFFRINGYQ